MPTTPPTLASRAAAPRPLRVAGHFVCDVSLQALSAAQPFARAGCSTPVQLHITRCGPAAPADTVRGAHRMSVRFDTTPAPWTLHACSLPLCLEGPAPEPWRDGAPLAPWLWLMSDRALPRSYRMMQGFGTRSWRLVPAHGAAVFARLHWIPAAGTHALAADEAEQLALVDPHFLRRDLCEAVAAGARPTWALALQVFSERQAAAFGFDPLDPGPLLPHDSVPLRVVGRLVLDQVPGGDGWADDEPAGIPGIEPCPAPRVAWPEDDLRQAQRFWHSQSGTEQRHLVAACHAACAALPSAVARERLRARLALVDRALAGTADAPGRVGAALHRSAHPAAGPMVPVQPAAALSLRAQPGERSVRMRRVALLLADGFEPLALRALQRALRLAGARAQLLGLKPGTVCGDGGTSLQVQAIIGSSPSVLWDAVVLPAGAAAQAALARSDAACRFVQAQFRHGKPILQLGADHGLLARLGLPPVLPDGRPDPALVRRSARQHGPATPREQIKAFLEALALPRRYDRGPVCAPMHAAPGAAGPVDPGAAAAAGLATALPAAA